MPGTLPGGWSLPSDRAPLLGVVEYPSRLMDEIFNIFIKILKNAALFVSSLSSIKFCCCDNFCSKRFPRHDLDLGVASFPALPKKTGRNESI